MCVYLVQCFMTTVDILPFKFCPFVICSMFEQSNFYLVLTFSFKNILNRGIKQVN